MAHILMHHPSLPDRTVSIDERSFEKVWKGQGWKKGEYKAPKKKSSSASSSDASAAASDSSDT